MWKTGSGAGTMLGMSGQPGSAAPTSTAGSSTGPAPTAGAGASIAAAPPIQRPLNLFLMRGLVREAGHWGEFRDRVAAAFPASNVYCLECLGCGRYWRERTPFSIGEIVERLRHDLV